MTIHPSPVPPDPGPEIGTGEHPATREYVRTRSMGTNAISIASVVGAVGICFGAYRAVLGEAKAQAIDAGHALEQRVTTVEQEVPQLRSEVFEARKDMRELQNVILTHRRSERLDKPVTPPTTRDGGP